MSNIVQRGITGFIFVLVLVSAIVYGGYYFQLVFGFVAILGLNEFYQLFKKSTVQPNRDLGVIIGLIWYLFSIVQINQNTEQSFQWVLILFLALPLMAIFELYRQKKDPFTNVAISILGFLYVLFPFIIINQWRVESTNYWPVLSVFVLTWTSDTFAYLVGRKLGKHKLFERISPKKSWEGFIGGMVFSVVGGILIAYFTESDYIKYLIYGFIIPIVGTLGDLVESMLKRSLKIKDSGNILPGHGGILDRFDAVLLVIPVLYAVEKLFL